MKTRTKRKARPKDKGFLGVRIDPKLRQALDAEARRLERSTSWLAIKLISEGLEDLSIAPREKRKAA